MQLLNPVHVLVLVALVALAAISRGEENVISGTVHVSLGTNQAVREAIVYLAGLSTNGNNHRETNSVVIIDQQNSEFIPRIQLARSGSVLVLRNSDAVLHVVRIDSMNSTNEPRMLLKAATPYAGYEKKFQLANFIEPTLLRAISCNGQDSMAAYIAIMPHPWAALTDENGRFTLRGVPAGKHKIYAWHEVFGTLVRDVQVNGTRTGAVDFQYTTSR